MLGTTIGKFFKRAWIPLVIVLVMACGAYVISGLRGVFGSENRPSYAAGPVGDAQSLNPKQLVYEVFGPAGASAHISYFDVDSEPQEVERAPLPWSFAMTSDSASVVGSVVAQGDSDSIGCRIVVDGQVKAEKVSNEMNAFTHCLVKGA